MNIEDEFDELLSFVDRPKYIDPEMGGDIYLNLYDYGIKVLTKDYAIYHQNKAMFMDLINQLKQMRSTRQQILGMVK